VWNWPTSSAVPSINNLKLRASYGVTGNRPPDPYLSLLRFGPGSSFFFQGNYVPSYGPVSNPNPNLRWEKKAEFNIGFDYALLGDKLFGAIDYYTRTTTDLLQEFAVPVPPNLFNRTWFNVGEIKNSGLELLLNYRAVDKPNFSYTPTVAFTYYIENNLVSLSDPENGLEYGVRDIANMGSPGQNNTPTFRVQEGGPIGQMWGLIYEGIAPNGDWIHRDINNDGKVDNTDRTFIGNGLPDIELGWGNSFRYGKWDMNIFFRGLFGHDIINSNRAFYEVPNAITSYNVLRSSADLRNPDTGTLLNSSQGAFSSLHVESGNFFKLDNMSIGYNFSAAGFGLPQHPGLSGGNNLFVLTNYNGSDPELRPVDTKKSGARTGYRPPEHLVHGALICAGREPWILIVGKNKKDHT
jgi:TonB-dependent starch-binding outer membrane protein SusC